MTPTQVAPHLPFFHQKNIYKTKWKDLQTLFN